MEKEFFRQITESVLRGEPVVVATVLSRSGSAPREAGAALAVLENGALLGTVGGGPLEARVIATAADVAAAKRPVLLKIFLTDDQSVLGGLICGGQVEVLIDVWDGVNAQVRRICENAWLAVLSGKHAWIVRSIAPDQDHDSFVKTGLGLMTAGDFDEGSLDPAGLDPGSFRKACLPRDATIVAAGSVRYQIQPVPASGRVIIAGAGHVGRELAALCALMGWDTVVIDDRPGLAHAGRFPAARIVTAQTAFENCFAGLNVANDDRIVIVTRGHEHDRSVLFQALSSGAGYIGMIGSRRKRDAIYESLINDGVSRGALAAVHCPIGLSIGAQTPAEIAVSIVAELIAVKGRPR